MKDNLYKTLFYLLGGVWLGIFLMHFIPDFNEAYYAIPIDNIKWKNDHGAYAIVSELNELKDSEVESLYITQVPYTNYLPVQIGIIVTITAIAMAAIAESRNRTKT